MERVDALLTRFMKVVETIVMVAFAVMLLSSILQVFFRHYMPFPVIWTEELARLLNVAVTYLGAAVLWLGRHHIRIEVIDRMLPDRVRCGLWLALDSSMAVFIAALLYGSIRMAEAQWPLGAASMPWLSMGWVYLTVGLATVLILMVLARDIVADALGLFGRGAKPETRS